MELISIVSYAATAALFLVLSLLLTTSWRGRLQGALLVSASLVTTLWAVVSAAYAWQAYADVLALQTAEVLRDAVWVVFLISLLGAAARSGWFRGQLRAVFVAVVVVSLSLLGLFAMQSVAAQNLPRLLGVDAGILGLMFLSLTGLVLLENLYRNTRAERRWAIKYLCFGIGAMFAYDFYLYSDALLFKRIDPSLWAARGAVNAGTVPLIAVATARNPEWSLDVFVSRRIVLHTVTLISAGVYLLAMAAGGYYIRYYGGTWGVVLQAIFLSAALLVLVLILFSGQFRARIKVLVSKHFFTYKYDYREEWLRFIRDLGSGELDDALRARVIRAIAEIVDSTGGVLFVRQDTGHFEAMEYLNVAPLAPGRIAADDAIPAFMRERGWVINLDELRSTPEIYQGLELPAWLGAIPQAWLVVPLIQHNGLIGFVVLNAARAPRTLNWEDNDFLRSAGQLAASHLAQLEATRALVNARQFEAFNRLAAFVVHDLKNLIGQLTLLVKNAARHKQDPMFVEDMVATVENSVAKMNHLMAQLRAGKIGPSAPVLVDLAALLGRVVEAKRRAQPVPVLKANCERLTVRANQERLASVFGNFVQNAQEATAADGSVEVRLERVRDRAVVEIEDTGCGMEQKFIRERLYRPFDTTKGESGMGIGAYESREFILGLGGELEVESAPGKGTRFRISLPLAPP